MPNLRGKTWTETTPANVEDAQFWEDHLVGEGVLEGMQEALVVVDALKHWHNNKATLDELSEDEDGDLNFKGEKIKGGGGISNAFTHVKVGSETIEAEGADSFELVAGSNVTMSVNGKQIIINSAGGGGEAGGDMYKSEFVLPGGTGKVLAAKSADNATSVGNADTEVLEGLSDNAGNLNYKGQPIGGSGQGGSVVYISTTSFKGYPVTISITDRVTGVTETKESVFDSKGKASFNIISVGTAVITVMDEGTPYTSTLEITCYSVYEAPSIDRFRSSIIVTARCGTSYVSGAEIILNGNPTGVTTDDSGIATVPVGATGSYVVEIRKDGAISDNKSTVNITSEASKTCSVYIARIKYEFNGNLEARVTGGAFAKDVSASGPSVYVYVPRQQVYTLSGKLDNNDVTVKVNVSSYDEFAVSVISATINVATETGAVVTATSGIDSYSATATDGVASIKVGKPGTYTVSATIDNVTSEDIKAIIINNSGETKSTAISFAKIILVFDGMLVADVTKNAFIHNINTNTSPYTILVPGKGSYNLVGTLNDKEIEATIDISEYTEKEIDIKSGYIYVDWLNAANMSDTYGSLENLLEDEKAIRELMTKHASVNFLVEWCETDIDTANTILSNDLCAKWINLRDYALDTLWANETVKSIMDVIDKYGYGEWALIDGTWQPKGNVPVMTSNTAPYGEAIASSTYDPNTHNYYKAFNGDNGDSRWVSANGDSNPWVGYGFVNPILVSRIAIQVYSVTSYSNVKVQGSNKRDFSTIDYESQSFSVNGDEGIKYVNIDNTKYCLYWRICYTDTLVNAVTLQFYGRSLNVSVPKMTSNTEPWGEAICNTFIDGDVLPWKAFDRSTSTWWAGNRGVNPKWIGYKFTKDVCIKGFSCQPYNDASYKGFKATLVYSDDGLNWVETSGSFITNGVLEFVYISEIEIHQYWAVRYEADSEMSTIELNFYGLDYSEREFEQGSNMKYIYDHGVELEEIVCKNNARKETDYLYGEGNIFYFHTKNKINFFDNKYKLMRLFVDKKITGVWGAIGTVEPHDDVYTNVANANMTSQIPYGCHLDISNVNGEYYSEIGWYTVSNPYITSVSEWWLE